MIPVEQELLELAGKDARAVILLSAAYDAAQTGEPVDVETLRPHMFPTDDPKLRASLDFIAMCLPRYITEWEHSRDIRDGLEDEYRWRILDELFKLRHGEYPCGYCGAGTVDSMQPWVRIGDQTYHECADCRRKHTAGKVSHVQILRVVS